MLLLKVWKRDLTYPQQRFIYVCFFRDVSTGPLRAIQTADKCLPWLFHKEKSDLLHPFPIMIWLSPIFWLKLHFKAKKKSALAMFYHCLEITNISCTSNTKNVVKEDMKPLSFWVFCLIIRLTIALTSESAIHYVSIHTLSS